MLKSERGIALVMQDVPDVPTITVENYLKWYTLYVVNPDGAVTVPPRVAVEEADRQTEAYGESAYADHVPNPRSVYYLARLLHYNIHEESMEMIIGRWEREYKYNYNFEED